MFTVRTKRKERRHNSFYVGSEADVVCSAAGWPLRGGRVDPGWAGCTAHDSAHSVRGSTGKPVKIDPLARATT